MKSLRKNSRQFEAWLNNGKAPLRRICPHILSRGYFIARVMDFPLLRGTQAVGRGQRAADRLNPVTLQQHNTPVQTFGKQNISKTRWFLFLFQYIVDSTDKTDVTLQTDTRFELLRGFWRLFPALERKTHLEAVRKWIFLFYEKGNTCFFLHLMLQ